MSLYKYIATWAEAQEQKRTERKNQLTKAGWLNSLHSLSGEMHNLVGATGEIIVQRMGGHFNKWSTDLVRIFDNLLDDKAEKFQLWIENTLKLYDNVFSGMVAGLNNAAEVRHQEAEGGATRNHNNLVQHISGLLYNLFAMDRNNSERYLALQERFRQADVRHDERMDIMLNTCVALHRNTIEHIQKFEKVKRSEPSVGWMMDNAEEIIRLGKALENIQENNVPQQSAILEAVKSIRNMGDYGMIEIRDALFAKATVWGVG